MLERVLGIGKTGNRFVDRNKGIVMETYDLKDSGVVYLGQIPKHWITTRLKNFGLGSMTNGLFKKKEHYGKGTKLVNVTDLYQKNNIINFSALDRVECDGNEIKRYSVNEGDIFFVRSSLKMEGIGVSALAEKVEEDTVFECHIIRFKTNQLRANPKFVLYQLNSICVHGSIVSSSKTVTMTTISQDKIASVTLARPALNEQKAIADYLDKACQNIDKTIALKQQQLVKLEAYRKSVIHEAVTKGLDKTVPMKDSGVEWLGKVPNHWSVSRLKNFGLGSMTNGLFKKKEFYGKGTKLVNVTDLYQKNNIINFSALDRVECDSNEIKRYSVNEGDIFFVRSSLKMEGIGVSALVEKVEEDTVFECHIIRFKTNQPRANPKFILYQLNSMCVHGSIVSSSKTVTMTTISQDKIASIKLTRPDINEQKTIADYLDKACTNLDKTKETIAKQIKTLTQYRQSLIHECVTGKKRVYQGTN